MRTLKLKIHDLFTGGQRDLKDAVREFVYYLGIPELENPFYNIIRELATNGLKAIYKRIFYDQVVSELEFTDISYQEWLHLFKTEIESHSAKNLGEQAKLIDQGVDIIIDTGEDFVNIDVVNPGLPTDVEKKRIEKSIKRSMESKDFAYLLDSEDDDDLHREGAGIGLPLVIMTLKGLGIDIRNFKLFYEGETTRANIRIGIEKLVSKRKTPTEIKAIENINDVAKAFYAVGKSLDHFILIFDKKGEIREASKNFIQMVQISKESTENMRKTIPDVFYEDIFTGPQSILNIRKVENYRIKLQVGDEWILYNINGILNKRQEVITVWQKVLRLENNKMEEGDLLDKVKIQNITQRYVPATVLQKAKEAVRYGKSELPSEIKEATAFFTDIIGFTTMSETMEPPRILDLLNTSLSVVAKTIAKEGGTIDKFMGDAVFSLFDHPINAIIAGVKIQNAFEKINEFRALNEEPPIFLRVGIHTGNILIGSVGTMERMEWTAIGDVINTAYRIEENADKSSVLISDATYQKVKDQLQVKDSFKLHLKGKMEELLVHHVKSVKLAENNEIQEICIP